MENKRLSLGEWRFMNIIWANEPIGSGELVKLTHEQLGWAKSTMYTRLRLLAEKGYIANTETVVTSLISQEQAQAIESNIVVNESFGGSLPGFIAAFFGNRKITGEEAADLERLIREYKEG